MFRNLKSLGNSGLYRLAGLGANTASTGLSMSLAQSLTAKPVQTAVIIVPSLVPTMVP